MCGEAGTEGTAVARLTDDIELGLMAFQRMLDDGQPQTGTTGITRTTTVYAVKAFSQAWQMFGGNTRAVVTDRELGAAIFLSLPAQGDMPAFRRVAHRIAGQVAEHTAQLLGAAAQEQRPLAL